MSTGSTAAIVVALIVAALSAGASIFSTWVNYQNTLKTIATQTSINKETLGYQALQDRNRDERALRDAKLTRIRGLYVDALDGAYSLSYIAARMQVRYEGETTEQRDAALLATLIAASGKIDKALIELELETGAEAVLLSLQRARKTFASFREMRQLNLEMPGSINWQEVRAAHTAMESSIDDLLSRARRHLGSLEQPIPVLPARSA